ncbi:MAG: DUF2807 domain-containing protein [Actinobacteria bacterium]|nr:DUF2807 domain-containing protein [Actinomycetota bacterium]
MFRKNITGKFKNLIGILILSVMIILLSIFTTSCIYIGIITGSGKVVTEERDVSGFDSISIGSSMNLIIEQTGSESLKIEAEDNIIPLVKTSVIGKELVIKLAPGIFFSIFSIKPINCYVTVKDLKGLKVSSSSSANCKELTTDKLDINVSSSGRANLVVHTNELNANLSSSAVLKISGDAVKQNIKVSSSGNYEAENLLSKECTVRVSSSGSATVNVSDLLNVNISSSGQVNYTGKPEIHQEISSSGSLNNITK